jgi:hypothetical protein|tara:strand:- start:5868 stop:6218 length:351 start_codon:yes stop_codon:yes gene_type:complete
VRDVADIQEKNATRSTAASISNSGIRDCYVLKGKQWKIDAYSIGDAVCRCFFDIYGFKRHPEDLRNVIENAVQSAILYGEGHPVSHEVRQILTEDENLEKRKALLDAALKKKASGR